MLRFWESRFTQIRPLKRGGGRRYYRPDDVDLLRGVRHLLYGEGYTIRGVQRILREEGLAGPCRASGGQAPNCRLLLSLRMRTMAESAGEFLEGEAEAEDEAESEAEGEVGLHKPPARAVVLCRGFHNRHANGRTPRAQSGAAGRRAGAALGR